MFAELTFIRVNCCGYNTHSVDTSSPRPLKDNWLVITDHAAISVHVQVVV